MLAITRKKKVLASFHRFVIVDVYGNKRLFDNLEPFLETVEQLITDGSKDIGLFVEVARFKDGKEFIYKDGKRK